MNHTKGISSVISSTLFILIGLVAVAILAGIIIKVATNPKLGPGTSCIDLQISPPVSILDACYRSGSGDLEVRMARGSDGETLSNVVFTISNASERMALQCGEACGMSCVLQEKGSVKTYYLNVSTLATPSQVGVFIGTCDVQTRTIHPC